MQDKCLQCLSCGHTGDKSVLCPLDCLPVGSRCKLVEIEEPSENILRLMEMGLIPGTNVVIERTAPLNSPFSVRLPGCTLAVRREDARHLLVAPLTEIE
ncbi:MAG: ferrous iron transport protein A [Calditrichaeota bacterium]|nr:ferrous iron transport protein A [Calditrichota bacterium]MCB9369410.1 ferrous iron transport protein A [Calditrichota bacterium]